MKTLGAIIVCLLSTTLQAQTRVYLLEIHDDFGQLVATHRLELEPGPRDARGIAEVSGTLTADRVEDAYRHLLDGTEPGRGFMSDRHLRLNLTSGILSPPLKIEAVAMPDQPGAFEGRWRRFDCFRRRRWHPHHLADPSTRKPVIRLAVRLSEARTLHPVIRVQARSYNTRRSSYNPP